MEVGAPVNRICVAQKSLDPDAPAEDLKCRYLDRSSPLVRILHPIQQTFQTNSALFLNEETPATSEREVTTESCASCRAGMLIDLLLEAFQMVLKNLVRTGCLGRFGDSSAVRDFQASR